MSDLTAGPLHAATVLVGWMLGTAFVAGFALTRRDAR